MSYTRYHDPNYSSLNENDEDQIRDLLIGRTITKVNDNTLALDDGTVLEISANEGCGGCSSGWYELDELNEVPNVITAVDFEEGDIDEPEGGYGQDYAYRIFVLAESQKIKLLDVTGTDGNGYYGTGYSIWVKRPTK